MALQGPIVSHYLNCFEILVGFDCLCYRQRPLGTDPVTDEIQFPQTGVHGQRLGQHLGPVVAETVPGYVEDLKCIVILDKQNLLSIIAAIHIFENCIYMRSIEHHGLLAANYHTLIEYFLKNKGIYFITDEPYNVSL